METLKSHSTANNPVLKVVAGVIFIILPILGFILGMQYQSLLNSSKTEETVILPTPHLSDNRYPTPISSNNETVNWKTYTNNDFSFKYPAVDWTISENEAPLGKTASVMCDKCTSENIDLFQVVPVIYKSNEEYISKSTIKADYVKTTLNGVEAVKAVVPGGPQAGGSTMEFFVVNKGQGYLISFRFTGLMDRSKLTDFPEPNPNILSTFRFTKQTQNSNTTNNSTIKIKGLIFNIPQGFLAYTSDKNYDLLIFRSEEQKKSFVTCMDKQFKGECNLYSLGINISINNANNLSLDNYVKSLDTINKVMYQKGKIGHYDAIWQDSEGMGLIRKLYIKYNSNIYTFSGNSFQDDSKTDKENLDLLNILVANIQVD